jgi:hypothetical protein
MELRVNCALFVRRETNKALNRLRSLFAVGQIPMDTERTKAGYGWCHAISCLFRIPGTTTRWKRGKRAGEVLIRFFFERSRFHFSSRTS